MREVNIFDLMCYVCLKWRIIIASAIVFSIIFCGLGYMKTQENNDSTSSMSLEDYNLLDAEKEQIDLYLVYEDSYKELVNFIRCNDFLLESNPNEMYLAYIEYVVQNTDDAELISRTIVDKILLNRRAEDFSRFYNAETIELDNDVYATYINEESKDEKVILRISIYEKNEESCNKAVLEMEEYVNSLYGDIKSKLGSYELLLLMDDTYQYGGEILNNYISFLKDSRWGRYTAMGAAYNALSPNARNYIDNRNQNEDNQDNFALNMNNKNLLKSLLKYVIMGCALGVVLVIGLYSFIYIFTAKIRFEDDFKVLFNLNVLGRISKRDGKNRIDNMIRKMRHSALHIVKSDEIYDVICSNIKLLCEKNEIKSVFISGSIIESEEQDVMNIISEKMKEYDIKIVIGKSLLYYPSQIGEVANSEGVILVEKGCGSRNTDILEEVAMVNTIEKRILGLVVLE